LREGSSESKRKKKKRQLPHPCTTRKRDTRRKKAEAKSGRLSHPPSCDELRVLLFEAPGNKIAGVEGDTKEIGGNEAELRCANSDNADYGAVESGHDPALPEFLTNEHGGEHRQNAG
jgi:hypothetical protein